MNIEKEINNNPILAAVQQQLIDQTEKGINKYGATVNAEKLTHIQWANHAKEEITDLLVYLECFTQSLENADVNFYKQRITELEDQVKIFTSQFFLLMKYYEGPTHLVNSMARELKNSGAISTEEAHNLYSVNKTVNYTALREETLEKLHSGSASFEFVQKELETIVQIQNLERNSIDLERAMWNEE